MKEQQCAWCVKEASGKLCSDCRRKALNTPRLSAKELEELPYGVVKLDAEGRILSFNRAEEKLSHLRSRDVIGRNFFTEIAPCANVRLFRGRFRRFLNSSGSLVQFTAAYCFSHGPVYVCLVLVRANEGQALMLISKLME